MGVNKDQVKGRGRRGRRNDQGSRGQGLWSTNRLEAEGIVQKAVGQARAKFGDFKKAVRTEVSSPGARKKACLSTGLFI
jgi:hypothetical protein